ncbi:hypothetical protein [Terrilactibacillus laevilacticus]|uniref:Uncharacterized protein n=1 Tax=Terrilactibacillus laevilacticus TaxID=1380157 RepID=A0ABW5PSM9_9BACI|nr:hypothetical protein [Terrilactibacillus laevilacticus]
MMHILPYFIAILFMTLIPSIWREHYRKTHFYYYQIIKLFVGCLYIFFVTYFKLIDLTYSGLFVTFVPLILVSFLIDIGIFSRKRTKPITYLTGFIVIFLLAYTGFRFIYPLTLAHPKYNMANAQVTNEKEEPVDIQHIPVVPKKYARYKSEKLLGSVSNYSYYELGDSSIQKIDKKLYWVTPIEFKGFFRWMKAGTVPGYIKMNAEDENAEPQFIKEKMDIVPSAYFNHHLDRVVRAKYPHLILYGDSFEPDDNGKSYYVVSYGHYTKFRQIRSVDGVIVVDPTNGKMKRYSMSNVPSFIDQVIPDSIAEERNEWFGKYKHGFFNSLIGKKDVHEPTKWKGQDEVTAVFNRKGQMQWFTDHTINNTNSGSMVGYTLMDARSGQLTYYTKANGIINGGAAINVVNKTFKREGYKAVGPTLYNIYGQYSWVVPVLDDNGVFRNLAVVNAENEKMMGYSDNKRDTFNNYKNKLSLNMEDNAVPSDMANTKTLEGKVIRVYKAFENNRTITQFMIKGQTQIFTVTSTKFPYSVFLEPGESVRIQYVDNQQDTATVMQFANLSQKNE